VKVNGICCAATTAKAAAKIAQMHAKRPIDL
jgi:hypothetical protein